MKTQINLQPVLLCRARALGFAAGIFPAAAQSNAVATAPVFIPDYKHSTEPLPDGVLRVEGLLKGPCAPPNGRRFRPVHLQLHQFISRQRHGSDVHPSCGCTTAELPPVPWTIPPGTNGQIKLTVNLQGKSRHAVQIGQCLHRQWQQSLMLRINILPPFRPCRMTERAARAGHGGQGRPAGRFQRRLCELPYQKDRGQIRPAAFRRRLRRLPRGESPRHHGSRPA